MTASDLALAEIQSISEKSGVAPSKLLSLTLKSATAFLGCAYASGTKWAKAQLRHDFAALKLKSDDGTLIVSFVLDVKKRLVLSHVESPLDDLEYFAPRVISDTQIDIRNGVLAA